MFNHSSLDRSPLGTETSAPVDLTAWQLGQLEVALYRNADLLRAVNPPLARVYEEEHWSIAKRYERLRHRWEVPATWGQRVREVLNRCVQRGLPGAIGCLAAVTGWSSEDIYYLLWRWKNEPGWRECRRQRGSQTPDALKFSLLLPTPGDSLAHVQRMIQSLERQTWGGWELRVGFAGAPDCLDWLQRKAANNVRIGLCAITESTRAATINRLATEATGAFLAVLAPTDALPPWALATIAETTIRHPETELLYSDEDQLDARGARCRPLFKPDWSPDTLRSHPYLGQLLVFRRTLFERIGGCRTEFDGALAYDFMLRASEQARAIVHIPAVLYHRGANPPLAPRVACAALHAHLTRCREEGEVSESPHQGIFTIRYAHSEQPLLSVIIPTHNNERMLQKCLAAIERDNYLRREILIVENGRAGRPIEELARHSGARVLRWSELFHYARLHNKAVGQAQGEVLLFLNDDVEFLHPDCLQIMLEHALRPEVGVVGAKLSYPDNTIQHAGVILGVLDSVGHPLRGSPAHAEGYGRRLVTTQNLSAVTAACLMMRREVFEEVGGFDEDFPLALGDVDLCLRVRRQGYRVVWTPLAEARHRESQTRGGDHEVRRRARFRAEIDLLQMKWPHALTGPDPYYSPHLTLTREDCSLNVW